MWGTKLSLETKPGNLVRRKQKLPNLRLKRTSAFAWWIFNCINTVIFIPACWRNTELQVWQQGLGRGMNWMSTGQGNNRPHQRCAASPTTLTAVESGCSGPVLATKHDITPISNFVLELGVLWLILTGCIKFLNIDFEDDAEAFLLTSEQAVTAAQGLSALTWNPISKGNFLSLSWNPTRTPSQVN